jgi:hypothetical protein
MSYVFVSPHDVLIWPDGVWCFREHFGNEFMRESNYRVIPDQSPEWMKVTPDADSIATKFFA